MEVYDWSMDSGDRNRLGGHAWLTYLEGKNPNHPVEALQNALSEVRKQVESIRNDPTTPDTRLSDNPNPFNPARVEALVNLMTGGPRPAFARPMHCRLWYFDPERRRPGVPEDVAALVDHIGKDEVGVHLVNVNQLEERTVVVQAGAYAEHQFLNVDMGGKKQPVDGNGFIVRLAPGAGARFTIAMRRYVNQPTALLPWNR
jgi:hypothetical protein